MAKTEQDRKSKKKEDRKSKNEEDRQLSKEWRCRFLQAIRHLRPNLEAASLDRGSDFSTKAAKVKDKPACPS